VRDITRAAEGASERSKRVQTAGRIGAAAATAARVRAILLSAISDGFESGRISSELTLEQAVFVGRSAHGFAIDDRLAVRIVCAIVDLFAAVRVKAGVA
jgi:hypothetical protein